MQPCKESGPLRRLSWWIMAGVMVPVASVWAQSSDSATQELLRQQARERALREQQEATPDVRLQRRVDAGLDRLPADESPCFPIQHIRLEGDDALRFQWALKAADRSDDPVSGRCLGTGGVGVVMKRIQNAIVARGYVTTRVLATPQDLHSGVPTLTVVPGRIRAIRFAPGTDARAREGTGGGCLSY